VLTQPYGAGGAKNASYVAASYVKFVEAGGARAAVVPHAASDDVHRRLFDGLNGLLLPGGDSDIRLGTPLRRAANNFVRWSRAAAAAHDDVFPVVGHCMGFELLLSVVANSDDVLSRFDAENLTLPLTFNAQRAARSALFGPAAAARAVQVLSRENVTLNNHVQGVTPHVLASTPPLAAMFGEPLTTNVDRKGATFVSTVEAVDTPWLYAFQYHPEKNAYEWRPDEVISHSPDAVEAMAYLARHMVSFARRSTHRFASWPDERRSLFYNYAPRFSGYDEHASFEQVYVFDDSSWS